MRIGYIYLLEDTRPEDERGYYIGKTVVSLERRLTNHLSDKGRSSKIHWIQKMVREGWQIKQTTLEQPAIEFINDRERYWIATYRERYGRGRVKNNKDGGDGGRMSEESRRRATDTLLITLRNPEVRRKMSIAKLGKPQPRELVEKRAAAKRGKKYSAAHAAAVSLASKGKPKSPEHCAALKAAWERRRVEKPESVGPCKGMTRPPLPPEVILRRAETLRRTHATRKAAKLAAMLQLNP